MGECESRRVNLRDINALGHITSDLAKALTNYKAIMNGLVTWSTTDNPNVTVRLATDEYPFFVDYTFPSRAMYRGSSSILGSTDVPEGAFDIDNELLMVATKDDVTTLRLGVESRTGNRWSLYEDAIVYVEEESEASREYASGDFIRLRRGSGNTYSIVATTNTVAEGGALNAINTHKMVRAWKSTEAGTYAAFPGIVVYRVVSGKLGNAYMLRGGSLDSVAPWDAGSEWEQVATSIELMEPGEVFSKGSLYIYARDADFGDAALYMFTGEPAYKTADADSLVPVSETGEVDTENWYGPVAFVPAIDFDQSTVLRRSPSTSIRGYIARFRSGEPGKLSVVGNVAVKEGTSEPHRGMKVFDTSNYVSWPASEAPVWSRGKNYSTSVDYTAKMVFHHADEETKMVNYVNYDGPDLDRGLAIYLPVNDLVRGDAGEAAYVKPQDGMTFEFMFRIWPDTSLNGAESPDLILNKAQVYVYSADVSDDLENAEPIAKISMARLTNFYVWAENIAVPNRPVFIKAKFEYSEELETWLVSDFYQVPDHVFLSPKGFVDPTVRNDAEGDTYGTAEPYTGVQTAGFPLMQDPFGGMDLNRIRLNRIENN